MKAALPSRRARGLLVLLVVVAAALLASAILQRDRALERVYEDAQDRAELYTRTVLRSSLTPLDLAAPLDSQRSRALMAEIQAFVLTDPTVARVRLWRSDGTLLFSTDRGDHTGEMFDDPAIGIAADGLVDSRLDVDELSPATAESTRASIPLFETFTPLRLRGATGTQGAAEVDQFAAELEQRADDRWWLVQIGAAGATAVLAVVALISVARGRSRRAPATSGAAPSGRTSRRKRRPDGGWDGDADELRQRLERATTRAHEAEEAAQSFAARLQQVTGRLESLERQSPNERVDELKEALRRSEAERSLLRAGRPETVMEAQVRQLRRELREAQSLAKAAEALVAGGGDLTAVQEQLSTAARQVETAVERAKVAEGRAEQAEDRARSAGDMATAAEQRIDLLEAKLQEIAASGIGSVEGPEQAEVERLLAEAHERVAATERRATEAEARLATAALEAPATELLEAIEARVRAAEERGAEAEARVRAFEELEAEGGAVFRQRLGRAAGRKLAAATPAESGPEPELDLRAAIARGLRAPLTRAVGLALSLQGSVESGEGKNVLRQLSASLRRLDQLAADLHDVHRIADGTLPMNRRRTDLRDLVTTTLEEADHIEDRLIRLDADSVHAVVDPARVRQIVEGMLEAAKERTRSGAAIVVRVRDADAGAWISVEDDNRTPAAVGPEISLASRLAKLHGTEVVADGSSLRVVFPRDDDAW
jgi:hypothetical protein